MAISSRRTNPALLVIASGARRPGATVRTMGTGHSHGDHADHGGGWNFPLDATGRILAGLIGLCAIATVVGVFVLWPDGSGVTTPNAIDIEYASATVLNAENQECSGGAIVAAACTTVDFRIEDGLRAGATWSTEFHDPKGALPFEVGQEVVLTRYPDASDPAFEFAFADYERKGDLTILFLLFAAAIIALGRWVGVRALISLVASLSMLAVFALPAILDGQNPVLVALVGSAAVALVALYLTHGVNHLTTVALLGSFASLTLTGVLAWVFIRFTSLTGLADESVAMLQFGSATIDARGLLLAGIVIGTLGVLDDVTITQASAVSEVHNANPDWGFREMYQSGLRVGRAHIASTTNTLVLAYAGASLPLLLLFTRSELPLGQVFNSEVVAAEVVRTLVGTIGLISAVPLTTALAAIVIGGQHGTHDHESHFGPGHDQAF